MSGGPVGIAVVGCGTISTEYLRNLTSYPDVDVRICADLDVERARAAAAEFGVPAAGPVEDALADGSVEVVVNLTIPAAHVAVGTAALRAGKHVYSEKPLALDTRAGAELLQEAYDRGLRVACAPDTFLGAGLQNAQRIVASGAIGVPQSALTAFQVPGPDRWHPSPEFLFAAGGGPLFDLGPYYLTMLVQLFGPMARVAGLDRQARAERMIATGPRAGITFGVGVPTHTTALIEFLAGPVATTIFSFDSPLRRNGFVEITGTEATLRVPDPNTFDGPCALMGADSTEWEERPAAGPVGAGRGVGVLELARALRAGVPHRASGNLAQHVLSAMEAIAESAEDREFQPMFSGGARSPEPLPADWSPTEATLTT